MKITETIFQHGAYHTRKVLNRSNAIVKTETLDQIEQGVTSEQIDHLKLPVFKYKTQITIHGRFPEIESGRVQGYKWLIRNQNGSLGVRYNAVDAAKKDRIYKALRIAGFKVCKNSSEWYAYWGKIVETQEQANNRVKESKELVDQVKTKDLFIGTCSVIKYNIWGTYYVGPYFNIAAVYEKDVESIIEAITGKTESQLFDTLKKEEEERTRYFENLKQKQQEAKAAKAERERPHREAAEKAIQEAGYNHVEGYKPQPGDRQIIVTFTDDLKPVYTHVLYNRTGSQRYLRMHKTQSDSIDTPDNLGMALKIHPGSTCKGWVKKAARQEPRERKTTTLSASVTIVNYSDKSIAVVGNTYPIKEKLKSLGAKWNRGLKCGPGWVLPIDKKHEVLKIQS